jgi:DNA repair exonuclease SbcCD ATPase subunit
MNKQQKATIDKADALIQEAQALIQEIQGEQQEIFDEMSDKVQQGPRGEALQAAIEQLEMASDECENIVNYLAEARG